MEQFKHRDRHFSPRWTTGKQAMGNVLGSWNFPDEPSNREGAYVRSNSELRKHAGLLGVELTIDLLVMGETQTDWPCWAARPVEVGEASRSRHNLVLGLEARRGCWGMRMPSLPTRPGVLHPSGPRGQPIMMPAASARAPPEPEAVAPAGLRSADAIRQSRVTPTRHGPMAPPPLSFWLICLRSRTSDDSHTHTHTLARSQNLREVVALFVSVN